MAKTVSSICEAILYRLSDSGEEIWTIGEIHGYLKEGYNLLAVKTGCFWDTIYLEDQETAANVTSPDDINFLQAGDGFNGRFSYTSPGDKELLSPGQLDYGPTACTQFWEIKYLAATNHHYRAVHDLPENLIEIERSTWNNRRIDPMRSSELEWGDSQYQTQNGEVLGYLQDKDGIKRFRKWRIPSVVADSYIITGDTYAGNYVTAWEPDDAPPAFKFHNRFAYTQAWEKELVPTGQQSLFPSDHTALWEFTNKTTLGLPRIPTDLTSETIVGSWGIARRIPGQHPCAGSYPWGFPRRPWKAAHNTKIEYTRKGQKIDSLADTFELPDRYVKYLRHFATGKALERNGPGQDSRLAAFWLALFEAGITRITRRKRAVFTRRVHTLGGESRGAMRPPLARPPANYGRVIPWP